MVYPKVHFVYNQEKLANYLCYLAKQIACGFYQDRRFLVLPKLAEKESRSIYFPDLTYSINFWQKLQNLNQNRFVWFYPKETIEIAAKLLRNSEPGQNDIEKEWKEKEEDFFKLVKEFIPKFPLGKVESIDILPTPFGTVGSFFFEKVGKKYKFYLTVRIDFGASQIAESILSLLAWIEHPTPKLTLWYQKESNIDFLLTHCKIGELFNYKYIPTVSDHLAELPVNLVIESQKYLEKLGFPIKPILENLNFKKFTQTEKRILENLIKNKNRLVTYDEIGNWFWGENESLEKFSLYSVAKVMEKIRKGIKDQGIYQEIIFTVRGKGYVIYD